MTANFLFWFQVVMAWVYTVPQVLRVVSGNTKGLTLALYAIFMAYLVLGLSLSVSSYKEKAEKVRKQTIIIFAQWTFLVGTIFILGIKTIPWRPGDTVICIVISVLSVVTIIHYGAKNPFTRGLTAVWCKSVPQLWLAYTMISVGSSQGLPWITLIAGNLTGLPRCWQVYLSGKKGGWDKPTKSLFIGELSNVLTWGVVSVIWVIFQT